MYIQAMRMDAKGRKENLHFRMTDPRDKYS